MNLIIWILEKIEKLFTPDPFLGVLLDNRPQEIKELDPLHEEVAMGISPVSWTVKSPEQWNRYTLRNQNLESSDCCAFSTTTGLEAEHGLTYPLSARDIYDQRSNYPDPGMIPFESVAIPATNGVLPDSLLPSDNLTEEQLNVHVHRTQEMLTEAAKLSGGIPVKLTTIDIDTIASLISQKMTVRLCFHFSLDEWTAIPQLIQDGNIHHQVVGTDFSIVNGKKSIIIQDSCFPNTTYVFPHGLRVITQDYLNARCYSAVYIKKTPSTSPISAPQHVFTVDMQYGDNNNEVLLLQAKLQTLGFFPITPTGSFGGITKQAVIAYQRSKSIPNTGYVGTLTRAALNS